MSDHPKSDMIIAIAEDAGLPVKDIPLVSDPVVRDIGHYHVACTIGIYTGKPTSWWVHAYHHSDEQVRYDYEDEPLVDYDYASWCPTFIYASYDDAYCQEG